MKRITAVLMAALLPLGSALAAEGSVTISSPKNGATLDVMEQNKLSYSVEPGPRGDHVHVYVDGKEVDILRALKGSYTLPTLEPGKHELCVKVVNRAHVPIGVEDCVDVTVQ